VLRLFFTFLGVVGAIGLIVAFRQQRDDLIQVGVGIGIILCFSGLAEVIRRQDQMARYLKLREIDLDAISTNDNSPVPDSVHSMADKLSKAVAKRVNEPVRIEAIQRENDDYRVMLLIGHPAATRKRTALIPVKRADQTAAWHNAASELLQRL